MGPVDKVEMNRMIHARAQELALPGSPAGRKAPSGYVSGLFHRSIGKPYQNATLDEMKKFWEETLPGQAVKL